MTFPRLRKSIESGSVALHGAYFAVATGDLSVLDRSTGEFRPIERAGDLSLPGLTRQSR